jgi:hypothetical protein
MLINPQMFIIVILLARYSECDHPTHTEDHHDGYDSDYTWHSSATDLVMWLVTLILLIAVFGWVCSCMTDPMPSFYSELSTTNNPVIKVQIEPSDVKRKHRSSSPDNRLECLNP